jgi:hypothetical protein
VTVVLDCHLACRYPAFSDVPVPEVEELLEFEPPQDIKLLTKSSRKILI